MRIVKQISRKFGVALAALMVLSVFLSAGVFGATNGSITITPPTKNNQKVDLTGLTVSTYKIFDAEDIDETETDAALTFTVDTDFNTFFGINGDSSSLKNFYITIKDSATYLYISYNAGSRSLSLASDNSGLTDDYITISNNPNLDNQYFEADLLSRIANDNGSARLLADWLEAYVDSATSEITSDKAGSGNGTSDITLDDLTAGYYLVIPEKDEQGQPTNVAIQNSILEVVNGTENTVELKADEISVEKIVENANDTQDTAGESANAAVGDIMNYTITTQVPNSAEFTMLDRFEISDTLQNQTLNTAGMTIKIGAETYTLDNNQFKNETNEVIATLTPGTYANREQKFTVDFNESVLLTKVADTDIELTYSATVTGDAVSVNGNDVTVTIDNGGNVTEVTDSTEVYTYTMNIQKDFSDQAMNDFTNVTFQLFEGDEQTALYFTGNAGSYKLSNQSVDGATQDLKLTTDGNLVIAGLDAGTYTLKETAAPDGYKKVDVTVTLRAGTDNKLAGTSTATITDGRNADTNARVSSDSLSISFTVLNQKGFNIPATGAMGTTLLTLGGIVLIVAAAGALVIARRKSAK